MKNKYIITFIAEFLVLMSYILVYRLAAISLGNVGFSEYALSRRALSLIQPALILGFGVAIPRYIAYSSQSTSKHPDFYFLGATGILLIVTLTTLSIVYLFRQGMAFLIFGSYRVYPFNSSHGSIVSRHYQSSPCYTYFQGKLSMLKANLLQTVNIAIVPVAFSVYE